MKKQSLNILSFRKVRCPAVFLARLPRQASLFRCAVCFLAALLIATGLHAQNTPGRASVGSMGAVSVPDVPGEGEGARGWLKIDLKDVRLAGFRGEKVYLLVNFLDARSRKQLKSYALFHRAVAVDPSFWASITLEVELAEISRELGAGAHSLRVFVTLCRLRNGGYTIEPVSGGTVSVPLLLLLTGQAGKDAADLALEENDRFIAERASRQDRYRDLSSLTGKYGISVVLRSYPLRSKIIRAFASWEGLAKEDDAALDTFLDTFVPHFGKLPRELIRKAGLKRIVLLKKLKYSGLEVGGFLDFEDRAVVIDAMKIYRNPEHLLRTVHHELFHFIDISIGAKNRVKDDPAWLALNAPGAKYAGGGIVMAQDRDAMKKAFREHPAPGFLNGYSMSAVEEDKAEVFACLFTPSLYRRVEPWIKEDPYLAAKFRFIRNFLKGVSGEFTDAYFEKLHAAAGR